MVRSHLASFGVGALIGGLVVGFASGWGSAGRTSPQQRDGPARGEACVDERQADEADPSRPLPRPMRTEIGDESSKVPALEARIEELEQELDAAMRRELAAAADEQDPVMYPLPDDERRRRMEGCEFYTESVPEQLPDDLIEALELTPREVEAYGEAKAAIGRRAQEIRNDVWREVYGTSVPTYDEMLKRGGPHAFVEQVMDLPKHEGDDDVLRRIEEERLGDRERPPDDELSPYARFQRVPEESADVMHRELAARIGEARTHEIRAFDGGWPGGRSFTRRCPSDPAD